MVEHKEYVPQTETVRRAYQAGAHPYRDDVPPSSEYRTQTLVGEDFDRWFVEKIRKAKEEAWEAGRAVTQNMWLTVSEWGGKVPDSVVEQMNPYIDGMSSD